MQAIRSANLGVRFLTELGALAALAFGSVRAVDGAGGILLAIVAPLVAATVWGFLVAPRARRRLPDPLRLGAEAAVFGSATAALVAGDALALAIVFGAIVVASISLMYLLDQRGM